MFGLIYFQPNIFLQENSLNIAHRSLTRSEKKARLKARKEKSQRQVPTRYKNKKGKKRPFYGKHNKDRYHK